MFVVVGRNTPWRNRDRDMKDKGKWDKDRHIQINWNTIAFVVISRNTSHNSCCVGNWQISFSGCTPLANILSSIFLSCTTNYMNDESSAAGFFFSVINLQRNILSLSIFHIYLVFIHLPIPLNMIHFIQESIFSFSYWNCKDPLISVSLSLSPS